MAVLNVKNFPDDVYARLKEQAAREHRSLAQQVVHLLTRVIEPPKEKLSWRDLEGLGKEIWEGIDPTEYVDEERRSWD